MSIPRSTAPTLARLSRASVTMSSRSLTPAIPSCCVQCSSWRSFTSLPRVHNQLSSRRKLQTATAYRPHTLRPSDLPPAPARNTGVPDTSIAGGVAATSSSRPPRLMEKHGNEGERPSISVREGEAQKSKPVVSEAAKPTDASAAPSQGSAEKPQEKPKAPRRKLRARKAAITLSPRAVDTLRGMLEGPNPKLIRVGVKNRGCSGLAYHLEYIDKPGAFDEVVEQDGVKVLVDSKALFSIIGSEMDWVEDKLSARFVFKNPNIEEQCGCGESFSIG